VLDDNRVASSLYGERNANLKRVERETNVQLHARGNELTFQGSTEAVDQAAPPGRAALHHGAQRALRRAPRTSPAPPRSCAATARPTCKRSSPDTILVGARARPIAPKGLAQKRYVDAIREKDLVFGIGPAGTGKTYLAMALALRRLMEKRVRRIVLTRPAVEAGERLGFLPGSMEEKVSPVPAAAVRRPPRHDGLRAGRPAGLAGDDRDRADRLHAWADAERLVRDPGRGPEHHQRADEDVPDPPRVGVQGGGHGRHHPDRSAPRTSARA
jgi:phosphate starvation-inducible PhoH-like protein